MANEVDLVIRAKQEATRAIDSVRDALKKLTGAQDDLTQSAEKTGGPLGRFAEELAKLNGEAQSIQSLAKVGEIVKVIGERSDRAEKSVAKTAEALKDLNAEATKTAQTTAQLKSGLDAVDKKYREQASAAKAAKDAQSAANAEYAKAARTLSTLEGQLKKAGANPSEDLMRQVIQQREVVAGLKAMKDAAAESYGAQKEARDKARKSVSDLNTAIRESEGLEKKIAGQIATTTAAHTKNAAAAGAARDNLAKVNAIAGETTAKFGDLATNEVAAADAAARVEAQIDRVTAAMQRQKQLDVRSAEVNKAVPIDPAAALQAQQARVQKTTTELAAARAELNRLGNEVNSAAIVTKELGDALKLADIRADQARQAFVAEGAALEQLAAKARAAKFNEFSSSTESAARSMRTLGTEARTAGNALQTGGRGAGLFKDSLSGIYGEGRQALSLMQRLRGEVLSLTAAYFGFQAAVQGIGKVIDAFRSLEAAQNRLGAVFSQDTQKVGQEINFLRAQANRLGIEFSTLSDEYAKFAVAAKAANFTSESTRKIFLSVAEAGRVNKLSNEALQGTFLALQQMVSKGKISAQELQQQLGERLPGAVTIFAKALGLTNAQLIKMQETGSVLATEGNLLKFADELTRRFGPQLETALKSTTSEIGRFQNNLFGAALQVAAGGFITSFTELLRKMNEFFASQEGVRFFTSLGAALGKITDAITFLVAHFALLKTALTAIVTIKIAGVFQSLSASFAATAATQTAATASTNVLTASLGRLLLAYRLTAIQMQATATTSRAAIAGMTAVNFAIAGMQRVAQAASVAIGGLFRAIGGVPGIVLTVVTLGLANWLTAVKDTTSAIEEHKRILAAVNTAYETVKDTTKLWADEIKGATLAQAVDSAKKLGKAYQDALGDAVDQAHELADALSPRDAKDPARVQAEKLSNAFDDLQKGTSDLKTLQKVLDEIALNPAEEEIGKVALSLLDLINKGDDGAESIQNLKTAFDEAQAYVRVFKNEATDVDKVLLGVEAASDSASEGIDKLWSESFTKLTEAMVKAGDKIPGLSEDLKRLGEIDALNKLYQDAIKFARSMSEVEAITNRFKASIDAVNTDAFNKLSGTFAEKVVGIESGGKTDAKNPLSSATGLGQFIESTWLSMFKKYFPDTAATMTDKAILDLRKEGDTSIKMIQLYAQENSKILQQAGVAVNDASLYLAHFLGPQGAVKVLSAQADTPVSSILAPQQIDANKSVLEGKSAGEVVAWAQKKMNITEAELAVRTKINDLEKKSAEKVAEFKTSEEQRIQLLEDQAANEGKISKEMAIQKAVNDYIKRAKDAGAVVDQAQIERIKTATAAEWERNNALKGNKAEIAQGNQLLATANALSSQRAAIEAKIKATTAAGDLTAAGTLQTQLTSVTTQLNTAIAAAEKFWQSVGGPQADAALAKIETLKVKTAAVQTQFSYFGLNMSSISSLVGSFADGVGTALDGFITAVANGENAMKALKTAFLNFAASFLREIAMMIIKQMVLNALSGIGGPIGAAAKALAAGGSVPTGHTGGVLGNGRVGNNGSKTVAPAVFAGAMRYHGGGVVGLGPDEIPMIGKRNEEMLTAGDPRHRNNGGMAGGSSPMQTIRNIVTLDPEFARSMLNSADGETATLAHVKKNRASVRKALGIN